MVGRVVAVVLTIAMASQTPTRVEPDWQWLDQARMAAFDSLMPMTSSSGLVVAYRAYRDLHVDVHERYFRIDIAIDKAGAFDSHTAVVVVPAKRSIQQQLLALHAGNPQASLESLLPAVALRRFTLTVDKCPAIRTRLDALSKLAIVLPDRRLLFLHPVLHRFVIDLPAAEIDATVSDEENSLVRWAAETAGALLACAAG